MKRLKPKIKRKRTIATKAARMTFPVNTFDSRNDNFSLLFWLMATSLGPLRLNPKLTKIFPIMITEKAKFTNPKCPIPIDVIRSGIEIKVIRMFET